MTTTVTRSRYPRLDADIWAAWQELLTARCLWARCPNADTIAAERAATAHMDKLLELRYRAQTTGRAEQ